MMEKEKIDVLIRETLSRDEAEFYNELEEQNLIRELINTSKSSSGWLVVIMSIMHILVFGFFIYCTIEFFDAEDTKELLTWLAGGFMAMFVMVMLKLYVWMQMDKNVLKREIKRLELQISSLSLKITK
ncbi:DUF6768 family protein [uncultured Maribacter sp.]|uniref:DUF6768 family protein n=1 Tax=uncultured Maribacter sp. TaxID=431308 RepID=UPI00260A86C4|nr:DUF6768 family protein [uncultured Maribacter sp.]